MKKYTWVDSLKGIAICGVIMVHSGVTVLPYPIGRLGAGGAYGVYIFIVMSAFLTYLSLEHVFSERDTSFRKICQWWYKKCVRLIPVFYLAILVEFILNRQIEKDSIPELVSHVLFIFGLFPQYINSLLSVEWYLGILIIFYFLAPVIYRYVNNFQRACIFGVASFIICDIINHTAIKIMPQGYIYESFFGSFWFFEQLPSLSLGIILFYLHKMDVKKWNRKWLLGLTIVLSSGVILARPFGLLHQSLMVNYTLCAIITVCLALLMSSHRCIVMDNPIWRMLGKYSYPIYLLHFFIIQIYNQYISISTGNVWFDWCIKYIMVIIIVFVLSVFITKYWDEPIQKLLLRKIN